ncbi:hypothetical protein R3W88_014992 [Solanum pinnatisectum]|uniref:F-box domain-containing protein n=1 Tax=Solanum pinnatisectum TaxID=50273 RepID=A0AAV9KTK6_9SOLN|nr:hypothetical protein R3W88_014992 [Solanum pinnatisectum]
MLPSDLLAEILSRLPAKNACQLKCVSKHWLNTISTPHFKKLHYKKSIKNPHLVVIDESIKSNNYFTKTLTISTIDHLKQNPTSNLDKKFTIDILFQHDTNFSFNQCFICYNIKDNIWLYNLTTQQNQELPHVTTPMISFDLGYIPCSNEFKIVHVFGKKDDKVGYEIITLKDDNFVPTSWRILENHKNLYTRKIASLSVNGSIYWLVYDMQDNKKGIVCLDLENEEFRKISCPKECSITQKSLMIYQAQQLVEVKGLFGVAQFSANFSHVNIFVLRQGNKKKNKEEFWVKEFSLNLFHMGHWFKILGFVPFEEDNTNGELVFVPNNGRLLLYNTKKGSFKNVGEYNLLRYKHHSLYFDSLFCLGSSG